MRSAMKKCLSLLIVWTLVYSPVAIEKAMADDLDATCGQALKDAEAKKSTAGDQKMGYCVQADIARTTKNVEIAKSIIFLAGAAACTTFAILIATAHAESVVSFGISEAQIPAYEAACKWTNVGASVGGVTADIVGTISANNKREKYGQATEQFSPAALTPIVFSGMSLLGASGSAVAADAATKGTSQTSIGCIMCAVSLGMNGAVSVVSADGASKSEKKAIEDAKNAKNDADLATTSMRAVQLGQNEGGKPTAAGGSEAPSTDSCANANGNAYLSCLGNASPEIAAITNSPEFMREMTKTLKGKNLGDFIKGYKGGDLAAYVAAGTGMKPEFVAHVAKVNDKLLKDSKFLENYKPMTYARAGGVKPKVSDDLDFSKMMAGLMGKMGGEKKDTKEDPSELVFRQMELLPADKIQANKDISLFARIAFRYRKKSNDVEQLNWSRPENQDHPVKK